MMHNTQNTAHKLVHIGGAPKYSLMTRLSPVGRYFVRHGMLSNPFHNRCSIGSYPSDAKENNFSGVKESKTQESQSG